MLELIVLLRIIEGLATDLHYCARGPTFYGLHLMADRIREPIPGFVDDLFEVGFLGAGKPAPLTKTIAEQVAVRIPFSAHVPDILMSLQASLAQAQNEIEKRATKSNQAMSNLLGGISQTLQQSQGFVHQTLMPDSGSAS